MKKAGIVFGLIAALLATTFLLLRTPDTDAKAMRDKYGGPDPKFAKAGNGMLVHYRDQGCLACPALLLVHGSNSSLQTFEPLIEILGERYRLISFDQPGHGLTGPHPQDDYTADGMFEAVSAVIDATGVDRFTIAGNSMGGWIAWRYTLANPQKVDALILMNSSGAPPSPTAEKPRLYLGARIMRYSAGRFLAQYITPRSILERSVLENFVDESKVTASMVDRYWELLRYPGNRRAAGLRAVAEREPEYEQRLGELGLPTLILWGAEDHVTPPHNANTFDKLIPNSRMQIFDGVGHLTMEEAPQRTATAIDFFLGEALP